MNLGYPTMRTDMDIGTFIAQSEIGNDPIKGEITQRPLDSHHAQRMALYVLKGVLQYAINERKLQGKPVPKHIEEVFAALGTQPYFAWSGVTVSLREASGNIEIEGERDERTGEFVIVLSFNQIFWVIDGQHRREAWERVFVFLMHIIKEGRYSRSKGKGGFIPTEFLTEEQLPEEVIQFWREALAYYRERMSVSMEIHTGLNFEQERQLFHDLNNLQKGVSTALAQKFDLGNPVNRFSRELIDDLFPEHAISEGRKVDWDDKPWMRLDSLNGINARLFLNENTITNATPPQVENRREDAWTFWRAVSNVPGIYERTESVAAQPALLKSIARVYYEIKWAYPEPAEVVQKFLHGLPEVDFSHTNPLWDIIHVSDEDLKKEHAELLEKYLPENWREKEVAERRNDGKIRFGNRHNESILVLPGIIRYLIGLPPSKVVARRMARQAA